MSPDQLMDQNRCAYNMKSTFSNSKSTWKLQTIWTAFYVIRFYLLKVKTHGTLEWLKCMVKAVESRNLLQVGRKWKGKHGVEAHYLTCQEKVRNARHQQEKSCCRCFGTLKVQFLWSSRRSAYKKQPILLRYTFELGEAAMWVNVMDFRGEVWWFSSRQHTS